MLMNEKSPELRIMGRANHSLRDLQTGLRHYLLSFPEIFGSEHGLFECHLKEYLHSLRSPGCCAQKRGGHERGSSTDEA